MGVGFGGASHSLLLGEVGRRLERYYKSVSDSSSNAQEQQQHQVNQVQIQRDAIPPPPPTSNVGEETERESREKASDSSQEFIAKKRLIWFGIVSAVGQMGQFAYVPVLRKVVDTYGWEVAVWGLAVGALVIVPGAYFLRAQRDAGNSNDDEETSCQTPGDETVVGEAEVESEEGKKVDIDLDVVVVSERTEHAPVGVLEEISIGGTPTTATTRDIASDGVISYESKEYDDEENEDEGPLEVIPAVMEALRHPPFRWISLAFTVCGYHIGLIGTHLPAFLEDNGVDKGIAAWSLSAIAITSTIGSGTIVWVPKKWTFLKVKMLLASLYFIRAILFLFIILAPVNASTALAFAFLFGFVFFTTVPLTTELVAQIHGTRYLGTLSAITFATHQVGLFLGTWLAGLEFDRYNAGRKIQGQGTGSGGGGGAAALQVSLWVAFGLAVFAGVVNWVVNDEAIKRKWRRGRSVGPQSSREA
ncbi:hypothetical protein HK102_000274 [Quaeritorhiza haematococci]|nr:hypothetical protein HK102_000274 [Quaeritorhiza haematococci]